MQHHVFIIGSRGLPANYGGFETFVENLVTRRINPDIVYHVACLSDDEHHSHKDFHGVDCFTIKPPAIGPARVIAYDMMALNYSLRLVKEQNIEHPVFCILGNTIGPLVAWYARLIHQVGGTLLVNPDGLEFKRSKWSKPVRAYLKFAEKCMARTADLIVSDNIGIQEYMEHTYPGVKSTFIAYGTDTVPSTLETNDTKVREWFDAHNVTEHEYYLIVGRFVPENNYESMIREFMASQTNRDLVIICNHEGNAYYDYLREVTAFDSDSRIKFVGTVYDKDLLTYIRENAFAYIHGHSVGGTNPGLLEALSYTDLNLVLDVTFNHSVAQNACEYWKIDNMDDAHEAVEDVQYLHDVINRVDEFSRVERQTYGAQAKYIIGRDYTWEKIIGQYEGLFTHEG
ncbi:glycosyltransferase family 1 protein [Alloscardovia theropitheci]|uniref:Glycosyltransferase family 1 protein n=1 Tax=Alloscardovia theropitheci TaxID=2496842 RepID=A0A4R0QQX2_9BIFI|nr:DUF1972 domain-containing protein [Alloscardovia theropitheci]TCD53738.1 glycosyltransferase family 1 protein [Alloscardovia theropitheci]